MPDAVGKFGLEADLAGRFQFHSSLALNIGLTADLRFEVQDLFLLLSARENGCVLANTIDMSTLNS